MAPEKPAWGSQKMYCIFLYLSMVVQAVALSTLIHPPAVPAKGMPLKTDISPSVFTVPETRPAFVFTTGSLCANSIVEITNENKKAANRFKSIFIELMFINFLVRHTALLPRFS
jgi:hypothetical protein